MRKFSTYDGLYTKKPISAPIKSNHPAQPTLGNSSLSIQPEYIEVPSMQLSDKAIKCYSAIKQHDDLVKALLNKH